MRDGKVSVTPALEMLLLGRRSVQVHDGLSDSRRLFFAKAGELDTLVGNAAVARAVTSTTAGFRRIYGFGTTGKFCSVRRSAIADSVVSMQTASIVPGVRIIWPRCGAAGFASTCHGTQVFQANRTPPLRRTCCPFSPGTIRKHSRHQTPSRAERQALSLSSLEIDAAAAVDGKSPQITAPLVYARHSWKES